VAHYIFDPSAHAVGTSLTELGWTERWADDAADAWTIQEPTPGLKVVRYETPKTTSARVGLSLDAIDSDVARADVELLMVVRTTAATYETNFRGMFRASGAAGAETGYAPGFVFGGTRTYTFNGYNGGTALTVGSAVQAAGSQYNTWVAVRTRINGTALSVKLWTPGDIENPSADEPESWSQTKTHATVTAAGWVGLFRFAPGGYEARKIAFATGGDTATFSAPAATPVAFTGTVGSQSGTEGTAFSLGLSTYFSGTETPFAYSVQSGTLPAGLSLNTSTGVISGTPTTAGVSSGIVIRATDATPDTADTNAFSITINAAGDVEPPTLTGSVTFASIAQTSYTAQWPAGSDNVAVTGYEYQIGSTAGAWTDAGDNLSAAITGRTAGATETVYVRAYDAAGLRSTPAISGEVTLESIPAAGINVTDPLKNNTGTVLASQSGVRVAVLQAADLVSVYEATGLTTNASGILATISNAAITTGQQYHVAIKLADGSVGITGPITAS